MEKYGTHWLSKCSRSINDSQWLPIVFFFWLFCHKKEAQIKYKKKSQHYHTDGPLKMHTNVFLCDGLVSVDNFNSKQFPIKNKIQIIQINNSNKDAEEEEKNGF